MNDKRILTVQDLSCLGHCSALVAQPVLSAWGHETCLLPTALLSTHTAFGDPYILQLYGSMPEIVRHWQREKLTFDAILVGYLGSVRASRQVAALVDTLLAPGGICILDPVMADHGKLYRGFDGAYISAMKELCGRADVLLPNPTEAALLAGRPCPETMTQEEARALLSALPWEKVILTGAVEGEDTIGIAVKQGPSIAFCHHPKAPGSFHGTGDLFAACFTGALMSGKSFSDAACFAAGFTGKCALYTSQKSDRPYGIRFEPLLGLLTKESGEEYEKRDDDENQTAAAAANEP